MMDNNRYTIPSEPPNRPARQRRSRWADLFEECRQAPGEWRKVIDPLSKSTASQLASDIRNAYTRDPAHSRVRGLKRSERWDTEWGEDVEANTPGRYYVWLRFDGRDGASHEVPLSDPDMPPVPGASHLAA